MVQLFVTQVCKIDFFGSVRFWGQLPKGACWRRVDEWLGEAMATDTAEYPKIRFVGLAIALLLSAVVVASLVLISSGLADEDAEAAEAARFVEAVAAQSGAVTDGYLAAPESAAQIIARSLRYEGASQDDLTWVLADLTATNPNIVGAFVGYPDGGFVDVRRHEDSVPDGFRVKEISIDENGERTVDITWTDSLLNETSSERDDADEYDPRIRPWFEALNGSDDVAWTDPYVFFTSQEPGITHSLAIRTPSGEIEAVVGLDVRLVDLNEFLDARKPSVNGRAVVIDAEGMVIATSGPANTVGEETPADPVLAAIPALAANADGPSPWGLRWTEGQPRVIAAQPVGTTTDWLLMVESPEDDFLTEVRSDRRRYSKIVFLLGIVSTLMFIGAALWISGHLALLRRLAQSDDQTGVLNHDTIRNELTRAIEDREGSGGIAAMILDLDDFKALNEQMGYAIGEQVLVAVSDRLSEASGEDALVGRLGVDEFLVVVSNLAERDLEAPRVFSRIVEEMIRPIEVEGIQLELHASAGYTTQAQFETKLTSEMLAEAEVALHQAKDTLGNSLVRFDDSMKQSTAGAFRILAELNSSIEAEEFAVNFRPEFDLQSELIVGAEATLCWNHPVHGLLEYPAFVSDLERFGLVHKLLPMQVEECALVAQKYADTDFAVRIHLAAEQIDDPNLVPLLDAALKNYPGAKLRLQVPEHTVEHASAATLAAIAELHELGIALVLDDFGTDDLSERTVQGLPVDGITIDAVFVAELESQPPNGGIAGLLVEHATALGVFAIANGVETAIQRAALKEIGCERVQGDLLGQPIQRHAFLYEWESGSTFSALPDAA